MLRVLKTIAGKLRHNLTTLDSQPVSKIALAVVLLLDYFILASIFQGLADHTSQMHSPYERIPQHCRNIVIDGDWNNDDSLLRIAGIAATYRNSHYRPAKTANLEVLHPACRALNESLNNIRQDNSLSDDLNTYLRLRRQVDQRSSEFDRTSSAYNTSLLETIARPEGTASQTDALQAKTTEQMSKMNSLTAQEEALKNSLQENPQIIHLLQQVKASQQYREQLLQELRRLNFWHPVKRLGMEMIFLLPLILVIYFWHSRSTANNRPYQTLVSSHLLVVVFIPVIFKLFELVYDIIPKKLLQEIFAWLESFNLVAIWHYLVIFTAVITALVVIYLLQKKIFSHERLLQKRIAKGLCQRCGEYLPADAKACPGCGFLQFTHCSHCQQETYVHGNFCRVCGNRNRGENS